MKRGKDNSNWKGGKVTLVCAVCNRLYKVSKCQSNSSKYCSQKCYHSRKFSEETKRKMRCRIPWNKGLTSKDTPKILCGKNHPNWKRMTLKCKQCGESFEIYKSWVKKGGGKFCSKDCYANYRRQNLVGTNNYFYGKKHTPEAIEVMRYKGLERVKDKDYLKRILSISHPTKPEIYIQTIIQKHNLPFRYVGDGGTCIGGKCPDFISLDSKKVVEVFGNYWHDPTLNPTVSYNRTYEGTSKHYKSYGYDCVILWANDIKDMSEDKIVDTIFCGGI